MMGNMKPTISDAVKQAIDDSGMSRRRLARQAGVEEGSLSRFCNHHGGLSTITLDRLADVLGLTIVKKSGENDEVKE